MKNKDGSKNNTHHNQSKKDTQPQQMAVDMSSFIEREKKKLIFILVSLQFD